MLRTPDRSSSSSTRRSVEDPSRFSEEQQHSLDELDPLHQNGHADHDHDDDDDEKNSVKLSLLQNGRSTKRSPARAYSVPSHRLSRLKPLRNCMRWLVPARFFRLVRARFFFLVGFLVALSIILGGGGFWAYKKGTIDGQSPPWYPTPRGGTTERWSQSYERAAALVRRMTLTEKVNVTTGTGWQMGLCVGNTGPATGVGFPSLCLQDGPLGIRFADSITATPAGVTVGATWNKELMYKRGRMLGLEARMKGIHILLGPSVGPLGRMPAGGRNWEGFGPDPVLQGIAAAQTIKGIQEEGVLATIKHFVGNEQEHFRQAFEWGLPYAISSNIDDRTLHEIYAWPFADSIRAGVASVMCSYNQVNNSYACQNSKLLNGILKDELGFEGFIQSDWLAQRSGVASALAGLDMSMPGDGLTWANGKSLWGSQLTMAVLNGSVPMMRLNDMVTRIIAAWYQIGYENREKQPGRPNFSSWTNKTYGKLYEGSVDSPTDVVNHFVDAAAAGGFSHRSLARRIAAEGIVLLKNTDEFLPLSRKGWPQWNKERQIDSNNRYRIGVYGEDAGAAPGGPNTCADRGCNKGTLGQGWGSGTVEYPFLKTPAEALRNRFYVESVALTVVPTNDLPSKNDSSKVQEQDLCIVFVNADSGEGYIAADGIRGDRNNLNLQKGGDNLIKDVASNCGIKHPILSMGDKTGPKKHTSDTIVVIHSVGPVILERFIDIPKIRAVVLANLPGQESGFALADVLFGDVNPSGRLPFTIGKSLADYGEGGRILFYPTQRIPQQDFKEGLLIDYRHFDANHVNPRFDFGYGLSYTAFELEDLRIQPALSGNDTRPDAFPAPRPQDHRGPVEFDTSIAPDPADAVFPKGFRKLDKYIYPYIKSAKAVRAEPSQSTSKVAHRRSQAGGGEGGNPELYETLVTVEATVVNHGPRDGQAVVQLYVRFPNGVFEETDGDGVGSSVAPNGPGKRPAGNDAGAVADAIMAAIKEGAPPGNAPRQVFGGPPVEAIKFPYRVLRGFEKVHTYFGKEAEAAQTDRVRVKFELTRRDLSYWSVRHQNWIVPQGTFGIEVGFSSRDDRLRGTVF